MKLFKYILIGMFALSACNKDDDKPNPPDPEPTPEPEPEPDPEPIPVTCDGMALGSVKDLGCPQGQVGQHKLVCTVRGWSEVMNSCAVEPTTDPDPTCDGNPLGTIKTLGCPQGQTGEHKQVCARDGWLDVVNSCKAVPVALKISLPTVYRVTKGNVVGLGVKEQSGVVFKWSTGESTNVITPKPDKSKSYSVTGTREADGASASATVSVIVQ